MDNQLLNEIIACLPKDRTLFRYAREDYALMLLARVAGDGVCIGDVRQSAYGSLLDKPSVRKLLAQAGNGLLSRGLFDYVDISGRCDFLLTLSQWNQCRRNDNQTSRHSGNLVLQVNFNSGHDREFMSFIGSVGKDHFVNSDHPVMQAGDRHYFRNTMAWVRMDVEFDADEVLIEEVQTDWLRNAKYYLDDLAWYQRCNRQYFKELVVVEKYDKAISYVKKTLRPYLKMWDEAALTAAINFIVDELGIKKIYYHSFDTGNVLKRIRYSQPPRSLYTDLPRKFCFKLTDEAPAMLAQSKVAQRKLKKVKQPRWYRLDM